MRTAKALGVGASLLVLAAGAYAGWPRMARLRDFSPDAMGALETEMWRDYYDHRYGALLRCLYRVNRDEYGFSPWDSLRVAYYAAKAAKTFQPTTSRQAAQAALPSLESYYALIQRRSREPFDVSAAARLELDWWQLRRENATPEDYGRVIARVAAEVYGKSNPDISESARLRALMMQYRDQRSDGRMREEDWQHIRENLVRSYSLMKKGVSRSEFDLRADLDHPVGRNREEVGGRAGVA